MKAAVFSIAAAACSNEHTATAHMDKLAKLYLSKSHWPFFEESIPAVEFLLAVQRWLRTIAIC